jgi:hypothetical protein
MTTQRKSHCRQSDNDTSKVQPTSNAEPKSSQKNSTGHEKAQGEPSDGDVDVSETHSVQAMIYKHVVSVG